MKKLNLLIAFLSFFAFLSCKKQEKNASVAVVGTWTRTIAPMANGNTLMEEIHFNFNGNIIKRTYLQAANNGTILGYYHKVIGKYRTTDNQLEFYSVTEYGQSDNTGNYMPENDLPLKGTLQPPATSYYLNPTSTMLTIGNRCPPNALCADVQFTYTKTGS